MPKAQQVSQPKTLFCSQLKDNTFGGFMNLPDKNGKKLAKFLELLNRIEADLQKYHSVVSKYFNCGGGHDSMQGK